MKKALLKDSLKEIRKSYKRFISIIIMAMLGVGFFVGIRATGPNMRNTADVYFDDQNVYDIRVISTLGLTNEDIDSIKNLNGVKDVYGVYDKEVLLEQKDSEYVLNVMQYTTQFNQTELTAGNIPQNENECVVEESLLNDLELNIGDNIHMKEELEEDEDPVFNNTELKIVGTVKSPLYISRDKGNSKLGSGKVNYYIYTVDTNINSDIYTSIYLFVDGAKELNAESKEYKKVVDDVKNKLDNISEGREKFRYDSLIGEATTKLDGAQYELNTEKAKAEKEIADADKKIQDAEKKLTNGENGLNTNKVKADKEFAKAESLIKENEKKYTDGKSKAESGIADANKQKAQLQTQLSQVNKGISDIEAIYPSADPATHAALDIQLKELKSNKGKLEAGIKAIETEITKVNTELKTSRTQLDNAKKELEKNKTSTYNKIASARKEIEKGKKELQDGKQELAKSKIEFEEEIKKAEDKLADAREKISDIENPTWYVLNRKESNIGYSSWIQDSESIDSISKVFPLIFFAVATLMSLTSMTRMVDEQRTTIGTLKALGYTKIQIASKYIIYSVLATLIGGVIGTLLGYAIIPPIIVEAYALMYILPTAAIVYDFNVILIGFAIASACIVGGAIYASYKKLRHVPSTLMRPKAPKPGKRVFLERVTFLWKRLKFTQKVTLRNIFRYKKRFLMTIIGIMGATSLVVVGFGIKNSIAQVIPTQYGQIYKYDMEVGTKDSLTNEELSSAIDEVKNTQYINGVFPITKESQKIVTQDQTKDLQVVVVDNTENLEEYITLRKPASNKGYKLSNDSVIITERLSTLLNIKKGDTIKIRNEDEVEKEVVVGDITEQYVFHYIYMTDDLYSQLYNKEANTNVLLVKTEDLGKEQEEELSSQLLKNDKISSTGLVSNNQMSKMMDALDYVVVVLIISSGLLTFIVLYSLSNVNISERIRELATLKVLGFYDKEVNSYVNKEMIILTIIGIVLGLFCGYVLNSFVLQAAEQEAVMYPRVIEPISYLFSALMVAAFTAIVSIVSHFALKKVDMVESLKSIE